MGQSYKYSRHEFKKFFKNTFSRHSIETLPKENHFNNQQILLCLDYQCSTEVLTKKIDMRGD